VTESQNRISLNRSLGLRSVFLLGIRAIICGGMFTLLGLTASYAGSGLLFVILICASIAFTTLLAYAELASAFPSAGGAYKWIGDAYGPFLGHLAGWVSWFAQSVLCALYALTSAYYALGIWFNYISPKLGLDLVSPDDEFLKKFVAVFVIILFGLFNFRGVASGMKAGDILTFILLAIVIFFIGTGLLATFNNPEPLKGFTLELPNGIFGIFAGAYIFYVAFEGSEIVAQAGEEIKNPGKNLPRGLILSFVTVVALYALIIFVSFGGISGDVPPWQVLASGGEGALVNAAGHFSAIGAFIMSVGGLVVGLAGMNATIYSSSHVSYAMGREGQVWRKLGRVHHERKTPDWALAVSLFVIVLMAAFLPLKDIASVADLLFIFLFALMQVTLIAMRRKYPEVHRPFRVPFYPFLQILALLGYVFIAVQALHVSPLGLFVVLIWISAGFIVYKVVARKNYKEEFAQHQALEEHLGKTSPGWHYRIVVPIVDTLSPHALAFRMQVAKAMALRKEKATIYLVSIYTIPQSRQLGSVTQKELEDDREFLHEEGVKLKKALPVQDDTHDVFDWIHVVHETQEAEAILDIVERLNADLLILGWRGWTKTRGKRFGATLDPILHRVRCDLLIVKAAKRIRSSSILLSTGGGAHAQFAASAVNAIAKEKNASTRILSVVSPTATEEEISEIKEKIIDDLVWQGQEPAISFVPGSNVAETIIEESKNDDIIVMAASRGRIFKEIFVGNTAETVARHSSKTVIIAKHHADIGEPIIGMLRKRFF